MSLGPGEVFIVLVVALLVLGPEKLPGAARQTSKFVRDFKRFSTDLTNQFHAAMDEVDPTKENKKSRPNDSGSTVSKPADGPHPGTEGFELIDRHQASEPLAHPDPAAPPAPGAPPGPSDPAAVQPVTPRPDEDSFESPPPDQGPTRRPTHRKGSDPLARFPSESSEDGPDV